ncbi:MAG TPA: LuxR C-terminal-related transcriptional regulator [Candidatus Limnocylindrales bacterium]|nr:LuxR C-terminal-related transcriptional regulator [Candidatus Limnocylindrales bacterium]
MPATMNGARFVGRDAAFVRLAPALEQAAGGEATTALVDGPMGVGVTRFLDELSERVGRLDEPFLVVRGRAYRPGSDEPFGPIIRALRPILRAAADDELARLVGSVAEDIVRLFPEVIGRVAAADLLPAHPTITSLERRQGRVLEALLGVVGRMADEAPILLVIEDLNEADAATRAFVSFASRIRRSTRICVIGSYHGDELSRDHPLAAMLEELPAAIDRGPRRIPIPPLERSELAELVQAIEGERPTGSALVLVADRSRGLPLVVEELLSARRELSDATLTGSLADVVVSRLGRSGPECRRILRLLALAGRPVDRDELAATAAAFELTADRLPPRSSTLPRRGDGALDPDLAAGLEEALERGVLVEDGAGIAFRHELIRRAAATDLLPRLRYRHHLALAAGLVAHPLAAATYWGAANVPSRAFAAAVEAAGQAESVHAAEDSLAALELALSLVESSPTGSGDWLDGPGSIEEPESAAASDPPAATPAARRATATGAKAGAEPGPDRGARRLVTPLQLRAAESAFAAGRPSRAVAYVEAVLGSFDERRDRVALGLLHERLGRYRRASGERMGSLAAFERAVELVPDAATVDRATVLASLAQARMRDGSFIEAEQLARDAMRIGAACGPEAETVVLHATTTLGVVLGWGDEPEAGVALLEEARTLAERAGDTDELFRVYANLTTVVDLVGRRREAVQIAQAGIEASRRAGLEAVYGNFLRSNAAVSLYLLGRWPESAEMSSTALEWVPSGVAFVTPIETLTLIEIESHAGELAGRLLAKRLVELETSRDVQHAVDLYRAVVSLALWQGDHADAVRAAGRGWDAVKDSGDWTLIAKMAASVAEADSMAAADAAARRDLATIARIRGRARGVVRTASAVVERSGVRTTIGSRREADAWLGVAAGHRDRLDGRDDPATWDRLTVAWQGLENPYEAAKARWRQAEAILGSGEGRAGRGRARPALEEAARIGLSLEARPLLRELRELAGRAMIRLPAEVDALLDGPEALPGGLVGAIDQVRGDGAGLVAVGPGFADAGRSRDGQETGPEPASAVLRGVVGEPVATPKDTFGLSRREREVLTLIADGRTNREIGERLFISQKTVGVHVGNILAKLSVSGRVEAAAVAIRLGLTEPMAAGSASGR